MKKKLGANTFLYPMPVVIVGADVDGSPNYMTVAYCGIVQHEPPMLAFGAAKNHFTNKGIIENGVFSVNLPSENLLEVTDFIGIYSGTEVDKASIFGNFYGKPGSAPMIEECPLNLECRLVKTLDVGGMNDIFIGEIEETHVREECLTNGLPDVRKMKPVVFSMHDFNYWKIGEHLARAWNVGKGLRVE